MSDLDTRLPGQPRWKVRLMYLVATYTPLRFMAVRRLAFRAARAVQRAQRRRLEARGDDSRSKPALFGVDVRLAERLGSGGFFIEAGANDGYTQSNTYYLERFHGWRGVLVEPLPDLAAEARRARPTAQVFECALVAPEDEGTQITMHHGGLVSIVAGSRGSAEADKQWIADAFVRGEADFSSIQVPGRTLSSVLDEAGAPEVTLLSLDLEGYEPQALRGLDLERHGPRWILVEAHEPEKRAEIEEVLGDRYVHVERFSEFDELYRRADVAA
jgi:FkbM family methyltransferase